MAKEVEKHLKDTYYFESIHYVEVPYAMYQDYCEPIFDRKGYLKGKALLLTYKPEMFALEKVITQYDLLQIYKMSDKTYNGFFKSFADYVAI